MFRSLIPNLLLVFCSIIFSTIAFEIFLRYRIPDFGLEYVGSARVENYEFSYVVNYNSHGFRGKEFVKKKKDGYKRIIFIGDSSVYGVGTDFDNTIPNLLEKHLKSEGISKIEVFNLGVPGINTTQYLRIAKFFSDFDPDIVLLGFSIDNDTWVYEMESDRLLVWTLLKFVVDNIYDQIFRKCEHEWVYYYEADPTYIQLACEGQIDPWLIARANRKQRNEQGYYRRIAKRLKTKKSIRKNIISIRNLFQDKPFYMVIFPSKAQVSSDYFDEMRKLGYDFEDNKIVDNKAQLILNKFLDYRGIEYIDLLPHIVSSYNLHKRKHYYDLDSHLNAFGNQVAATAIAGALQQ